ncbi:hypothetical protein J6590_022682 [Homalodisca vitripennis]|nr:hypothetical protein J6590_022682 [Homalodisca vitripennis]
MERRTCDVVVRGYELLTAAAKWGDRNRRRERVGAEPSSTNKSRKFVDWSEPSSSDKPEHAANSDLSSERF